MSKNSRSKKSHSKPSSRKSKGSKGKSKRKSGRKGGGKSGGMGMLPLVALGVAAAAGIYYFTRPADAAALPSGGTGSNVGGGARTGAGTTRPGQTKGGNEGTVRAIQSKLNALTVPGPNGQPLAVDGVWGPQTEGALNAFRRAHQLPEKQGPVFDTATLSAMGLLQNLNL